MWGPGTWMEQMWGFWWIFPLLGLLVCLAFLVCAARGLMVHGGFMCMRHAPREKKPGDLAREVQELREEVDRLKAAQR